MDEVNDPRAKRRAYEREWARKKRLKDRDAINEYQRSQYAKHREKRAADARARRAENREEYNARSLAYYHANRELKNKQRRLRMDKMPPEQKAAHYAAIQEWKRRNPERNLIYHAKRLITEQTGISGAEIPEELAEAKVMQILIHRAAQGSSQATPPKDTPEDPRPAEGV